MLPPSKGAQALVADYAILSQYIDDEALSKVANLFGLPRGWGTVHQDGPMKGVWYRRKKNGYHDLLQPDAFIKLIRKWPLVVSVSNHDGTSFNGFQNFAVFDFDNGVNPDKAKIPLRIVAEEMDLLQLNYLGSDSGGKGYHLELFGTAPVHTTEMERFQDVILERCARLNKPTAEGGIIGFIKVSAGKWAYFDVESPYQSSKPILDNKTPENSQPCTIVEFLTAAGEGKMIKVPFSRHPKYTDRMELPMTIAQILKHDRHLPQTEEDIKHALNIVKRLKRVPYERIIDIAQITDPQKPGPTNIRAPKTYEHVRFQVPEPSTELDNKCKEIFERIISTPCLQRCYEYATSENSIYHLRANLVTAFACMGYTRQEIAYFFKHHINDDADNANKGVLEYQVDYWFTRKYSCRCEYWQETDSPKFCCDQPCGRRHPAQAEPEPDHVHLTRVKEFTDIYKMCYDMIKSDQKMILAPKTTRAGFTTAMTISAVELGKKILFLVPRTSIAEQTFADTICLACEKRDVIINGFVISANIKSCLKRLQEKTVWEREHSRPLQISIPIPREDCKACQYNGSVVRPKGYDPLYISDIENHQCAQSSYRCQRELFNAGYTTYSKLFAILNTPAEDSLNLLSDIKSYDIIVFDEISQFVETSQLEITIYAKHRHDNLTFSYAAILNKQLHDFLQWVETGSVVEKIHQYINVFLSEFDNPEKFTDGNKISNPLNEMEQQQLKLDMVIYLNRLYEYTLASGNDVGAMYDALTLLCEHEWFVSKIQTMEYTAHTSFIVPPKHRDIVGWLKDYHGKIVITDATMPYQNMKDIFGPDLVEMPIGDPLGTAQTQLVICDSQTVSPTCIFTEDGTKRLQSYVEPIVKYHKDGFMVATPNSITRSDFIQQFSAIPPENVTYQRSNKTIGVACNLRTMINVSQPYAPLNAFDWLSISLVGDRSISPKIWKVNARNSIFQTIGRVKDPLAQTLSVVYAYGAKKTDMDNLLKGCVGVPKVVEMPIIKDIDDAHVIVADYWLKTGKTLSPNQIKVLVYHRKGMAKSVIREKTRLDAKFISETINDIEA